MISCYCQTYLIARCHLKRKVLPIIWRQTAKKNMGQIKKPGGSSRDGYVVVLKAYFLEIIEAFLCSFISISGIKILSWSVR